MLGGTTYTGTDPWAAMEFAMTADGDVNSEWITSLRIIMGGVERMMQSGCRIALVISYPLAAGPRPVPDEPGQSAPPPSTDPMAAPPGG